MSALRGLTLAVRFLLELGLLAALAVWGFAVGSGVTALLLGIGAPLFAAALWGAFVAPKARWPVSRPTRVTIEFLLFGAAALALAATGRTVVGIVFGILALATSLLNAAQEHAMRSPSSW